MVDEKRDFCIFVYKGIVVFKESLLRRIYALVICVTLVAADWAMADETLQLITTIEIERDSTEITSVNPVGDFNGDGYGDLMVGFWQDYPNRYEAANLYFGGPDFDAIPDLVFVGEQHIDETCIVVHEPTGFGAFVSSLGDFNGDGYDDLAIAAPSFCRFNLYNGRVYLYFGSANPDTAVDMILDGPRVYSGLGMSMVGGDFNGDTLGDILVLAVGIYYGPQVFIYLGDVQPDTIYDCLYDYSGQEFLIQECQGGWDLNGDYYADYTWDYVIVDEPVQHIFLGSEPLSHEPAFSIHEGLIRVIGDLSDDGIDDFTRYIEQEFQLCLGGNPLDLTPDYPMGNFPGGRTSIYSLSADILKLIVDDWQEQRVVLYNTGVPFDTIPYCAIDYGFRHGISNISIGDINADGTDDLALSDSLNTEVGIYSILRTEVYDPNEEDLVPKNYGILYCYPNPFNSSTVIVYDEPCEKGGDVRIEIYNLRGQRVKCINMECGKEGMSRTKWDATDDSGRKVSSGIYFVRARGAGGYATVKLTYLR